MVITDQEGRDGEGFGSNEKESRERRPHTHTQRRKGAEMVLKVAIFMPINKQSFFFKEIKIVLKI